MSQPSSAHTRISDSDAWRNLASAIQRKPSIPAGRGWLTSAQAREAMGVCRATFEARSKAMLESGAVESARGTSLDIHGRLLPCTYWRLKR